MPPARVRFERISKRFPGVVALDAVSFEVASGTTHALVGENGAGKSTLMKVLAGAHHPDGGRLLIDGAVVKLRSARDAQAAGVAIVYQELTVVRDLDVAENIFLGRWPRAPFTRLVDRGGMRAAAARLLAELGVELPLSQPVAALSLAQQQMVEIARALSLRARILVLDEPSAVLTPHELRTLFRVIREARQRGVSIVYISHRLDEIFEIADAVTVLRDGRHVSTRPIAAAERGALIAEMVGRPLRDEFPPRESRVGPVVLRVDGLRVGRVGPLSFEVRAGEVLGLTGLVGSGRSSVARGLFGAQTASATAVRVGETRGPFRTPRAAIAAGVALLPEDRKLQGLMLERPLRENLTLPYRAAVAAGGFIRRRHERRLAERLCGDLRIRTAGVETPVAALSGGNQQKVLLARWMSQPQRVMLLDEPTRGVDVGAKYEIYCLLNRLAADGLAVLLISSELPEVIGMCDRIGVMHDGRLAGVLDNAARDASQEQIMRLASGQA